MVSPSPSPPWVTRTSAEEIGEATDRRRGARTRRRRARARDEELLLAAKKQEVDELLKRVKETTEAAPHFQGSTDAAGLNGADEAHPGGAARRRHRAGGGSARDRRHALALVTDKAALRAVSGNARKISALTETF